jgi:predicted translin family RNA/ssDNA-binding protein
MVQTDISQLTAECSEWRQILRNYREEFHNCEKVLTETCKQSLTKDHLTQVEHFQNQFDIQLRNIHDLKQHIKSHERKVALETAGDDVYAEHESLLGDFLALENTLQELRDEFRNFVNHTSC